MFDIYYTLIIVSLLIVGLVIDRFKMSMLFLLAVVFLLIGKVITVDQYLSSFGNKSILTIFLLIIISAAVNEHFNLSKFLDKIFAKDNSPKRLILKLGSMVVAFSSLINNTTVVATLMPYTYNWANQKNISPSKLLMPLSFLAITGGMITLIGTSTNLLLNGLLISNGFEALVFSDFLFPGVLVSLATLFFLYFFSSFFLPDNSRSSNNAKKSAREYLMETKVLKGSSIIGNSIEEAQLRNLDGVFLTEIIRGKRRIAAVSPSEIIEKGDILLFAGETSKVFSLLEKVDELELNQSSSSVNSNFIEAVVSQNSNLDRKTLKDVGFREKYDAAVVGIHRKGERLGGKLGSISLRTGDLLLIDAGDEFNEKNNRWQDLIVISSIFSKKNISFKRRNIFWFSLLLMISATLLSFISLFEGLLSLLFIQVILGMIDLDDIKKNFSLDLFIVLTSSLAIGNALISSEASDFLASTVFAGVELWHPLLIVGVTFGLTFILTSFVTNVAALAIIFPIVANLPVSIPLPHEAIFLTIAFAASCSFLTPFAYQTNLMVTEAGNYRIKDFLKLGFPLSVVYSLVFLGYLIFKFDLIA